jgi:hypothetical protein
MRKLSPSELLKSVPFSDLETFVLLLSGANPCAATEQLALIWSF